MTEPKVSILIPCYNAEQWIAQAIDSALNQTYLYKEVIVIDDGSTDKSLEIIKSFGDHIYWETQDNQGGNATRNRLLELSTGQWLQYLDSDDYLLPSKIENQIKFLSQNNLEIDIVYSPSLIEFHTENSVYQKILDIPEPHDIPILLARWYLPQTGSPLWKKQAIVDVGGWKKEQPCCQEHELYLRLLKNNKIFNYCIYAESIYRQWSESTLCKKDKALTYKYRLEITEDLEAYLKSINELTDARLFAINQSRFDCARLIWLFNPSWAREIIQKIYNSSSTFEPPPSTVPSLYQAIYRFFGFDAAETIAKFKRTLFNQT